jgi:CheY-like chemotaxis protein
MPQNSRAVLWIDDKQEELDAGKRMLKDVPGLILHTARSSPEAKEILNQILVDTIVTDILRRNADGSVSEEDDGFEFFERFIRPQFPTLPVIFHTKNMPSTFHRDSFSQYLSKWDSEVLKAVELETRLHATTQLYEAFADEAIWHKIEPRLVYVQNSIRRRISDFGDVWKLSHDEFEELVAELLQKEGFDVLWVPGGKDRGVDIVAASRSGDFLIDVKHYSESHPVSIELVRNVYAVADSVSRETGRETYGGIITSSHFTRDALQFRNSQRIRPLLKDGDWLRANLAKYLP